MTPFPDLIQFVQSLPARITALVLLGSFLFSIIGGPKDPPSSPGTQLAFPFMYERSAR